MGDYLDDFLAPDDTATEASPYDGGATVGIVVSPRAKSSAELDAQEKQILREPPLPTEFREPDSLTIADYELAKAAGALSAEDEILVLEDLMTRIEYR